ADVVASDAQAETENAGLKDTILAYDITINDGWQPDEEINVSIESDSLPAKVLVYHIGEDGTPQEVGAFSTKDGKLTFPANGFSIYAITEDTYRRTYEFWDYKLGEYLPYEFEMSLPEDPDDPNHGYFTENRQIVKNGDTLVVPSLPNKDGMRFLGWYTSPTVDVNTVLPERGGVISDITAETDYMVALYARYGWPATITMYTRQEGTPSNQVFSTRTVYLPGKEKEATVDLSDEIHPEPPHADQGFRGWKRAGSDEIVDMSAFTLNGNVALYPSFTEVYEISFERHNEHEEYISPIIVQPDGISGCITDRNPVREGYTFAGWAASKTDADAGESGSGQTTGAQSGTGSAGEGSQSTGTGDPDGHSDLVAITDASGSVLPGDLEFDGGRISGGTLYLQKDITLHSLWTPEEVEYRVIFWKQRASDTKKLTYEDGKWSVPEASREYDFMGTLRKTAVSGSQVPIEDIRDAYTHLDGQTSYTFEEGEASFEGLVFHALREGNGSDMTQFTVAGDGSNIIHVFYDRELVTLRFDYPDDVTDDITIDDPNYTPELPASGTVTQKAVTKIALADYPDDITVTGLYGGQFTDGKTEDGEKASWPVSYNVSRLAYTAATRTMKYSGGKWSQTAISESSVSEASRTVFTQWIREDGTMVPYLEAFGESAVMTPSQTVENLCLTDSDSTVSYYKENEISAYPAGAAYPGTPAISLTALPGEDVVAGNPFSGYELDFFTYTDSRGTPIRREAGESLTEDMCHLTGGSFSNLKIYCKRKVYHVMFHNGSDMQEGPGVKYGMGLATDYVKQAVTTPSLPAELAGREDDYEFAGWFLDEELTIFMDFAGLKAGARSRLMQHYNRIQMIVSVYDYRPAGGETIPARVMLDEDLHLFAGWIPRRVLVQLDPDGGEFPIELPDYFWADQGKMLGAIPVSRNYIPAEQAQEEGLETYVYHIHTYEQSLKDNDLADRSARYLPASEEDTGTKYVRSEGSYRFLGWFLVETSANGTEVLHPYDHESLLTTDVKLRAQWSRLGVYRVAYEEGEHGKINGKPSNATYRDHATIALGGEVTADKGYVFTGWKIRKPDGSGEFYDTLYSSGDELVLNADQASMTWDEYAGEPRGVVTLVAQYEPVRGTSVTYYANGGTYTGSAEAELSDDYELLEQLRAMMIRDYGTHAAHHPVYDKDGTTVIGYTITGIEQNANIHVEDGTAFQREGYKLMGWSTTPKGDVELPLSNGSYYAATDEDGTGFVFYAVWKPEIQIIYNIQGGTWNESNGSEYRQENGNWIYGAGNGETAPVPYAPAKEGYTFAGWHTSSTAKSGLQTMPKVSKSITLYAIWTTNVIVSFDLAGGMWPSLVKNLMLLEKNRYG
ncbi:MAG: InlB B-repeat-containing protein, partial [Bacteroidales bacterium]